MSTAQNKEVIGEIFKSIASGDLERFASFLRDDVVYRITGSSPFSGVHTKQEWWSNVVVPLRHKLDGPIKIEGEPVFVLDGDVVCSRAQGRAVTTEGVAYDHLYGHWWRLEDGKVVEVFEWLDTRLTDEVFANGEG